MYTNGHVSSEPSASDAARITGGGLVHLFVSETDPVTFHLFLNEEYVPQETVESLSVYVECPEMTPPTVRATLARYVKNVTGQVELQRQELFPCTIEMVAKGRRISITCLHLDSVDGLWVCIGMKPEGDGNELSGLRNINLLVNSSLVHASLEWSEGGKEDLLPPL